MTSIVPEILDFDTQILEDSPMTSIEEKELVILKSSISVAYAEKMERDLVIGSALLTIFRRKLYRSSKGGRSWEQWLAEESAELTGGRGPIAVSTSNYLRGFYRFRCEILQPSSMCSTDIALPASPAQVRPLLSQLDTHPEAAVEIWKAACSQAGKGKVPTFDQVNRAAQAYKANEANEVRRLSVAQQAQLSGIQQKRSTASSSALPRRESGFSVAEPIGKPSEAVESGYRFEPPSKPKPAASWSNPPSIPVWEMEREEGDVDAGAECRAISQAIRDAEKAIGNLRAVLYTRINKHGSEYIDVLRQMDAGVYSLSGIDTSIQVMAEDIEFITSLLTKKTSPGELSKAAIDVKADPLPTRN